MIGYLVCVRMMENLKMSKTKTTKAANVGYIRVSTISQNTDRQLADLDIKLDKIFTDKASAKDSNRPALKECLEYLREGDSLHVHSIDRLARNLNDLLHIIETLNDKGVTVTFHKNNLSFDGNSNNPTNKLLLQLLGAVAEFERALINERIIEGIAARKAKGLPVGAPAKLSKAEENEIKERAADGESKAGLAKEYEISRQTIYRIINSGD